MGEWMEINGKWNEKNGRMNGIWMENELGYKCSKCFKFFKLKGN